MGRGLIHFGSGAEGGEGGLAALGAHRGKEGQGKRMKIAMGEKC